MDSEQNAKRNLIYFKSLREQRIKESTEGTEEEKFSHNRQLFLTEQGYRYTILYDDEVEDFQPATIVGELVESWPELAPPSPERPPG